MHRRTMGIVALLSVAALLGATPNAWAVTRYRSTISATLRDNGTVTGKVTSRLARCENKRPVAIKDSGGRLIARGLTDGYAKFALSTPTSTATATALEAVAKRKVIGKGSNRKICRPARAPVRTP